MRTPAGDNRLVTVFGGSGFLGRYVVRALAMRGYRIRVAVRRPHVAQHLMPLGTVGQILPLQANLRYRWSIERALVGAEAVVNLVGILAPSGRQTYDAVHASGARAIAECARAAGIERVVHVSAIGADAASDVGYWRSKSEGEAAMLETLPSAIVMRPSILFGPRDQFFNRFASMAQLSPVLPLIGGGHTRFQPVFAGDVGEAIGRVIDGQGKPGTTYECGGPEIATFRHCMELMLRLIERRRLLLPIPFGVAQALGSVLGWLPGAPLTADQVRMLRHDNVVSAGAQAEDRTLRGLGISPVAMEVILPTYLVRFRPGGQFTATGRAAGGSA